jgi:hypothetical protein
MSIASNSGSKTQSQTGTCSVCRRAGICIINTTGLLRQHGPRNDVCRGSHSHPFPGSVPFVSSQSNHVRPSQINDQPTAPAASPVQVNSTTTPSSSPSHNDHLVHPPRRQILKRIPKGARPTVANLLKQLIGDVLQNSSSSSSWSRLLGFSTSCLVKPTRGGKSRNTV